MSRKSPEQIIAVVGPTATGKTRVGAGIAKAMGGEVISVDSQQVYQELSIGVARPTPEEMQGVPHHMIGVVPPTEAFSAGHYAELACPILHRLLDEGKTPVLVGGTGFYLRALLQPRHLPQVPVSPAVRERLHRKIEAEGLDSLYRELLTKDPERAEAIHPHDQVRIIRALEIIELTGKLVPKTPLEFEYPTTLIGLTYADRERHVAAIRQRLYQMVEEGFLEEARSVYERYGRCFALENAHGYPELVDVIEGKRSMEEALQQIEVNIRQYSKRQMTWFRRLPGITWYFVDECPVDEVITDVVSKRI